MLNITLDTAGIMDLARALEAAGKRLPAAQALVLNRVGTRTRQVVVPTLVRQTGLSKRIITKAVRMYRASPQNPVVSLYTRGGDISLKYFNAREESGGVTATVKGDRIAIRGAFRRSGPRGNRFAVARLNGHVYVNEDGGRWRGHIRKVKSGVLIPAEMIRGATKDAFLEVVNRELPAEIARELAKTLPR